MFAPFSKALSKHLSNLPLLVKISKHGTVGGTARSQVPYPELRSPKTPGGTPFTPFTPGGTERVRVRNTFIQVRNAKPTYLGTMSFSHDLILLP